MKAPVFDLSSNEASDLVPKLRRLSAHLTGKSVAQGMAKFVDGVLDKVGMDGLQVNVTIGEDDEQALQYVPRLLELLAHADMTVVKLSRGLLMSIEGAYPLALSALQGTRSRGKVKAPAIKLGEMLIAEYLGEKEYTARDRLLAAQDLCLGPVLDRLIARGRQSRE